MESSSAAKETEKEGAGGPFPIEEREPRVATTATSSAATDSEEDDAGGVFPVEDREPRVARAAPSLAATDSEEDDAGGVFPVEEQEVSLDSSVCAKVIRITTASKALDMILNGGVKTGYVTELYWECNLGKSMLCHILCVTCQLSLDKGGGDGKAIYIDTEGMFRPALLLQIAEKLRLNAVNVLDNVAYARAYDGSQQSILLQQAKSMMKKNRFVVMVVDSATSLYRRYYSDIGEPVRQMEIPQFLRELQKLAAEFGVAVVITNQVVTEADTSTMFSSPCASITRIALRKGEGDERICKVISSPCLAQAEARFQLPPGFKQAKVDKIDSLAPSGIMTAHQVLRRLNHMRQTSSAKCKFEEILEEIIDKNRVPVHLLTGSRLVDKILERDPRDQFTRAAFQISGPDPHPSSKGYQIPWSTKIIHFKVPENQKDFVDSRSLDLAEQLEKTDVLFQQMTRKRQLNAKANVSWLWKLIDERVERCRQIRLEIGAAGGSCQDIPPYMLR